LRDCYFLHQPVQYRHSDLGFGYSAWFGKITAAVYFEWLIESLF